MTAPKRVACAYCGLSGHRACDCWVAARGAFRPDDIDRALASIDWTRHRDNPSTLRFQVSRVVRKAAGL